MRAWMRPHPRALIRAHRSRAWRAPDARRSGCVLRGDGRSYRAVCRGIYPVGKPRRTANPARGIRHKGESDEGWGGASGNSFEEKLQQDGVRPEPREVVRLDPPRTMTAANLVSRHQSRVKWCGRRSRKLLFVHDFRTCLRAWLHRAILFCGREGVRHTEVYILQALPPPRACPEPPFTTVTLAAWGARRGRTNLSKNAILMTAVCHICPLKGETRSHGDSPPCRRHWFFYHGVSGGARTG